MRKSINAALALVAALALIAVGCTDSPSKPKDPKPAELGSMAVSASRNNVVGAVVPVTAVLRDAQGVTVANYPVSAYTSAGVLSRDGEMTAGNQVLPLRTSSNGEVLFFVYSAVATTSEVKVTSSGDVPSVGSTLVSWNETNCGQAFTVTMVSPSSSSPSGGGDLAISGTGFCQPDNPVVDIGSVRATIKSIASDRIVVTIPPAPAGSTLPLTVDVKVTLRAGASTEVSRTLTAAFTYAADVPLISSISPTSGLPAGGNTAIITGLRFASLGSVQVEFGSRAATIVSVDSTGTLIEMKVPPAPSGSDMPFSVDVKVTNYPGSSYSQVAKLVGGYTYKFATTMPDVQSVTPQEGTGEGGDTVHVKGTGFSGAPQVLFGNRPAEITAVTTTDLTVITPPPPAGSTFPLLSDVTVVNNPGEEFLAKDTLAGAFQYNAPIIPPVLIETVSPRNCQIGGGCEVTITGQNFCTTASQLRVGGANAIIKSITSTKIVALLPAAPAGTDPTVATPVDLCLVCNPGTAEEETICCPGCIVYGCATTPAIFTVNPFSGEIQGHTELTIFGTGFNAEGGVQVFLDSSEDRVQLDVVSVAADRIKVVTPPVNRFSDYIDIVNTQQDLLLTVRLVGCGANATLDRAFHYKLPWAISTTTPTSTRLGSATLVAINGQGFAMPLVVTAASAPLGLVSVSDTQIIARLDTDMLGAVSCRTPFAFEVCSVEFAGVCAAGGAFTILPPSISSISPSTIAYPSGFPASVTLSGEGLFPSGTVSFGGTTITLPDSAYDTTAGTVTFTVNPPSQSALQSAPCFVGSCTGTQLVTTALELRYTPADSVNCVVASTIFVDPDDDTCRVTAPTANFTSTAGAALTHTVSFTDSSTVGQAGSSIVSRNWTFSPDGVPANATGSAVSVNFVTAGAKSVTLSITDSCGSVASTTQSVTAP